MTENRNKKSTYLFKVNKTFLASTLVKDFDTPDEALEYGKELSIECKHSIVVYKMDMCAFIIGGGKEEMDLLKKKIENKKKSMMTIITNKGKKIIG